MKRRRSTFRRKGGTPSNAHAFGYRAAFAGKNWQEQRAVEDGFRAARMIGKLAPKPNPGETHRQLAARLRADQAAPAETKPTRRKKAAA